MIRKLTTLQRPSILALLETTGTIESLAAMREEIKRSIGTGEIAPAAKTLRDWEDAIWVRVLELMTQCPVRAPFIYNVTLTWPKPDALQALLEEQLRATVAPLPAPTAFSIRVASKSTGSIQQGAADSHLQNARGVTEFGNL